MDLITKSPGLLDIAERIFLELDHEKLLLCEEVNSNWRTILRNPWFWCKKGMSGLDLITKSPGLLDIAESIFMELDHEYAFRNIK